MDYTHTNTDGKTINTVSRLNTVLIVTTKAKDAAVLEDALGNAKDGPFKIEWVKRLADGLKLISHNDIDIILIDLNLPDSQGILTFEQLFLEASHIPIMTLCDDQAENLGIEAVQKGAQGYLSKGHFKSTLVPQSLRNIIQRKSIEEALYKEQARAEIALNSISDAVLCTDINGRIDYLNTAAEKITGWSREEACGRMVTEVFNLINSVTRVQDQNPVDIVLRQNKPTGLNANTLLIKHDKSEVAIEDSISPIHNLQGKQTGAVIVFHDVSKTHALAQEMTYLAQHDFLTDLPNRLLINDRISQSILMASRTNNSIAILFLDLDNFKHINDSLGHAAGDKLLQSVSNRISQCVRSSDTVSRQGGDEFVILLEDCNEDYEAALIADKILSDLSLPHQVGNSLLHVTTSIGISVYPADGKDAETLIKNADTAMYSAKNKGRNNYQFFRSEMNAHAYERLLIEASLRVAIEKHEFELHYQPKVSLETGLLTGAEALLRWNHPEWGVVMPSRFISIAEDCGLIVPIGHWVLLEACRQFKAWIDDGLTPGSIAVNISAVEFNHKSFVTDVNKILSDTQLMAHCLQLEITESVLMKDAQASTDILLTLKDIGIQLAVDDFGTGYSSLSYLQQFPIDVLKIDQSFVRELSIESQSGFIVNAIISMAKSLNLKVVAEGVETDQQLDFLRNLNCEEGQGYIFSKPLNACEYNALSRPLANA